MYACCDAFYTHSYTRKKRVAAKKGATKAKSSSGSSTPQRGSGTLVLLATVVLPAVLAVAAAWHFEFRLSDWVPADWPTREQAAHLVGGGIAAIFLRGLIARLGFINGGGGGGGGTRGGGGSVSSASSPSPSSSSSPPPQQSGGGGGGQGGEEGGGVGGWAYGAVTPALVARIRAACPNKDQVFAALEQDNGDGDDDDEAAVATEFEISTHSRDMSFHKRAPPDVVVCVAASVPARCANVFGVARCRCSRACACAS
jgi:hypothetical protein